ELRNSMDQLLMTKQLLLARIESSTQTTHITADNVNSNTADNIVIPLDHLRLGEIKSSVESSESTWEDLCSQYPPNQSDFAPLSFSADSWASTAMSKTRGLLTR
ncbi:hypothetical protein IWW38_001995, partial [Coemansia aciculifera]